MRDIRELTQEELTTFVKEKHEAAFRAKQINEWLWKKNAADFEAMYTVPVALRKEMADCFTLSKMSIASYEQSRDGSLKYALRLHDNHCIEMVLIPSGKRVTVCISLQVGCPLACAFCATGAMGFVRNLEMYELYEQVILANELAQQKYNSGLSNIVLMGMGEPLLNFENVCSAIILITSAQGMAMSPYRITLSTAGIASEIIRLADRKTGVGLAVSLHSAIDSQRKRLMPIADANPLYLLSQALVYFHKQTNQRITIEYMLLADFNDSIQDAQALALFCKSFPVKINIIEYNQTGRPQFKRTSKERMEAFTAFLQSKNMLVQVRRSCGQDIDAACGQLAIKNNKAK
ncbi:MAG: 23S rRNA (adenine(2503)-C(2))-methyltransferase RlmN, partial [Bacteroidales bacterium]|jgi:23S rRNA (adenine2503-C2)-methyltransferase|nr:23S rRNA (adenine(2503)-C(2))-methyltransferase RlmN [Bacteroidales bacterium]